MKVVCIDNTKDGVKVTNLTRGKVYDSLTDIIDTSKYRIIIVNDKGSKEWYNNELFISLEVWREKQLNDLGI